MNKIINGYMALVGRNSKGGTFKYFEDKEQANIWAEITRRTLVSHTKVNLKKYITPMKIHKCSMSWCKDLIPLNESICLGCESCIDDARDIQQEKQYD